MVIKIFFLFVCVLLERKKMHNFGCLVGLVRISHTIYTLPLVPNAYRDFGWISLVIKYELVLKVVILEKTEPQLKEIKV